MTYNKFHTNPNGNHDLYMHVLKMQISLFRFSLIPTFYRSRDKKCDIIMLDHLIIQWKFDSV